MESSIYADSAKLADICKRSCLEVYASFGSRDNFKNGIEESEYYLQGNLTLDFHQYVKVSKAYWEYDGIELIAEVGGYVGLFLGVSVNQVRFLIGRIVGL